MNKQLLVSDFMRAAEQEIPICPMIPSAEIRRLRVALILEELEEFAVAAGFPLADVFVHDECCEPDIVLEADAIADLLYVVYGAAVAWGIKIDPVFGEVHLSNMSKFIDGHKREDGKWEKGPSYTPANIAAVLQTQMDPVKEFAVKHRKPEEVYSDYDSQGKLT